MKKRFRILILMLTLGFFLSPTLGYACGTKTEKSCCKKSMSSKTEKKDCCNNKHSKGKNNSCGEKCGHTNCTTSTVNFSLISSNEIEIKNNIFDFSVKKSKFNHSKSFISSGFSFVWLPPKIQ